MNGIELLGTFASLVVAASLMMKNIRWLRWVNLVGSTFFSTYGALIHAWPVFGLNAFIVVINAYYLVVMASTRDRFAFLEVSPDDARPNSPSLLNRFLETYGPDLAKFQPDSPRKLPPEARVFFVLREVLPISLFVCRPDDQGNQEILIDYAIPAWRDYQNARYLYQDGLRSVVWGKTGRFFAQAPTRAHARYLKKIGFQPSTDRPGAWEWTLGDPTIGSR